MTHEYVEQKRNRIKCLKCGDIVESKFRHDFRKCSCGACFVDGGTDYQRLGGNFDDIRIVRDDGTEIEVFAKIDEADISAGRV